MKDQHKISLMMAILVNISVMFGVGVFINTVMLTQRAGGLGFVSYLIIAFLMMPLIISLGKILSYYPTGGFYAYAAQPLSPLMGFISAWSYFIGKLGSAALIVDVFARLIKNIIPALNVIPTLAIDLTIISLFTLLNMFNVRTNISVICTFVVLKFIPVVCAIISSLYLWRHWELPAQTLYWSNIPSTLPLVLFAFVGFEAACSISRTIINPQKNAPKAIFYSFGIVICITTLYQFLFFLPLGQTLIDQKNYLGAFPALFHLVFKQEALANTFTHIIHLCAAAAALGGSYGILFSNHWNLYTLAEHNHTFYPKLLTTLNNHRVPAMCVMAETIICVGYLLCTQGNQLFLQQISVLGCSISYTISILALRALQRAGNHSFKEQCMTYLALGSCSLFIGICIKNLLTDAPWGLLTYIILVLLGIIMFYVSAHAQQNEPQASTQL